MKDYQNLLFPYAYNILGSSEDAKDAVQEVLFKYLSTKQEEINNVPAYLVKGVINQSINLKKKRQRLTSEQTWLPEPIDTENPEGKLLKQEILNYSLLVLLEKLAPKERAVFILKEAFDYSHKEIAEAFDYSLENARKMLSRAKKKLSYHSRNADVNSHRGELQFLERYMSTIQAGNMEALKALLAEDIELRADGGTKVQVVRELAAGRMEVAQLLHKVYLAFQQKQEVSLTRINHMPALLFSGAGKLSSCQIFHIQNGCIKTIYAIVDPDKLRTISS